MGPGMLKPLEGMLKGLEGNGSSGGMVPQTQNTEEQISEETKPDGTVCRTTLIMQGGKVQKNSTRCTKPVGAETAQPARRLQASFPGLPVDAQLQGQGEG